MRFVTSGGFGRLVGDVFPAKLAVGPVCMFWRVVSRRVHVLVFVRRHLRYRQSVRAAPACCSELKLRKLNTILIKLRVAPDTHDKPSVCSTVLLPARRTFRYVESHHSGFGNTNRNGSRRATLGENCSIRTDEGVSARKLNPKQHYRADRSGVQHPFRHELQCVSPGHAFSFSAPSVRTSTALALRSGLPRRMYSLAYHHTSEPLGHLVLRGGLAGASSAAAAALTVTDVPAASVLVR